MTTALFARVWPPRRARLLIHPGRALDELASVECHDQAPRRIQPHALRSPEAEPHAPGSAPGATTKSYSSCFWLL